VRQREFLGWGWSLTGGGEFEERLVESWAQVQVVSFRLYDNLGLGDEFWWIVLWVRRCCVLGADWPVLRFFRLGGLRRDTALYLVGPEWRSL